MIDIDQLEALAKGAIARSEEIGEDAWYSKDEFVCNMLMHPDDAKFSEAANPETVLALIAEVRARQKAIQKQARAAIAGMDAAKRTSTIQLKLAEQARAETLPDALASERAANAMLTEENEALREDAERYRWIRDVLRLDDARWMDIANWNQANISAEIWDREIDVARKEKA